MKRWVGTERACNRLGGEGGIAQITMEAELRSQRASRRSFLHFLIFISLGWI